MYTNSMYLNLTSVSSIFWAAILGMSSGLGLSADDSSATSNSEVSELAQNPIVLHPIVLRESELTESSGLAFSRRNDQRCWTHNDSGGRPRLYCFDKKGQKTGHCDLEVPAVDWEDIAAYSDNGVPRLLVADSGDNRSKRKSVTLYLFDEPDPDQATELDRVQSIVVSYPSGPADCEAIAVDPQQRLIIMIAKTVFSPATVYTVPLPKRITDTDSDSNWRSNLTANEIRRLTLPLVTGMDFDTVTGDLWVTSYFKAFRFQSSNSGQPAAERVRSFATLLGKNYQAYRLPKWKQIEAIAVDSKSNVWVTTEGIPARLGRLSLYEFSKPRPVAQE